ncbi:MAG: kinase/pyrophosphorylase [Hyphomicrobiales bacterium]|nr:kinase/pyrophosphorylase [Hyphomicrobiales bacterium]
MTYQQGPSDVPRFFHLHMVSDSSGETLTAIAKAAAVQYSGIRAIKHSHPFIRHRRQIDRIVQQIEAAPGIVFYTIVDRGLGVYFEKRCEELKVPCVGVLEPLLKVFESYLGTPSTPIVGGQHVLDTDYFDRIEAMNFTLSHDDGNRTDELQQADIVIIGASRTSKTPTSLYLANRGLKTANVSLVPEISPPDSLKTLSQPLVVGLVASPQRIAEIRRHRLLGIKDTTNQDYTDTEKISAEMKFTRQLCSRHGWATIDVTRRSIEETAAAIIKLREERVVDV